jgi:hypothetical protein
MTLEVGYMNEGDARRVAGECLPQIEEAVGSHCVEWGGQCHAISLAVLRTGFFGPGRVTRGTTAGPNCQHSWITLGDDVYDPHALIVDPTIWWYHRAPEQAFIHVVRNQSRLYTPNGSGDIWEYGPPPEAVGKVIRLERCLSQAAEAFLMACGPLDMRGWMFLANAPVGGWPSREIIEAICDTPALGESLVPIDIVGHLTDRNPGGLYR